MIDIDSIIRTAKKHTPKMVVLNFPMEAITDILGKDYEEKKDVSHIEVNDDDNFYDVVATFRDMILNSSLDAGETEAMMDAIDHICDAHGNDLSMMLDDYDKLKAEYYSKLKKDLDKQIRLELVAKLHDTVKEARKNGVIDADTIVKITPNRVYFYKDENEDGE